MRLPQTPARNGNSRLHTGLGPRDGLAITFIGMVVAVAACGQVSPSGSTAAVATAVVSPTAVPPASIAVTPSMIPTSAPAAARVVVARSGLRLPAARSRAVALAFGSAILLCGGLTSTGATTGSILRIDPRSGRTSDAGTLAAPVHDAGGAVLGAVGFIVGGGSAGPGSAVQRVSSTGAAITVGQLPAARADLAAVAVDGEVVVVGGGTPARPDLHVLATTDGRRFRSTATLLVGVRYPAVASLAGIVYVIGGSTPSGDTRVIQALDPRTGVVRIVGHLAHGLSHAAALVVGGALLIAGGQSGGQAQDSLFQFDVNRGTVTQIGRLPYPVSDMAAIVVDGVGYLIGGEGLAPLASIITLSPR